MHLIEILKMWRLFLVVCLLPTIFGVKILVYSPTNSRSHMLSNGRIADVLAEAGHNVTLLEVEVLLKSSDLKTAKHAKILTLGGFDTSGFQKGVSLLSALGFREDIGLFENIQNYQIWQAGFNEICDQFLSKYKNTELVKLKEEKFDVIISESLDQCGTGLKEALGIKTHFWVSSCPLMDHMSWILGVPTPLSYVPSVGDVDISDQPSYYERLWNIIEFVADYYIYQVGNQEITRIYRKHYGQDFPDVEKIARDSPITFVYADEFLDFPRPILHNTIYIGGLGHKDNAKGLEEPYKSEMEKGKNGVVYFSLGSNTNTNRIPYEVKKNLFEVFRNLPEYHFLVKVNKGDKESEELAQNSSNIHTFEWAPQPDILAHLRLKAFITHGGYNSLIETARAGVPIVTLPFFIDQWRNGRLAERNGWGVTFNKNKLLHSYAEFLDVLKDVLEHPSYQEKAQRTKKLVTTKPFSATEKFVKYVEFVLANDGELPELQNEGRNLSFFMYYSLDIFVPFVGLVLILVYFALKLIFVVFKRVFLALITVKNTPKKVKKQ